MDSINMRGISYEPAPQGPSLPLILTDEDCDALIKDVLAAIEAEKTHQVGLIAAAISAIGN